MGFVIIIVWSPLYIHAFLLNPCFITIHQPGQITIIPKPELRAFLRDSLTKPPFGVTSAEVAIICPDQCKADMISAI